MTLLYEQRVGLDRFVCLGYPFGLWCNNPSYKPGLVDGIWSDAWRRDGVCPGGPTQSPTVGHFAKLGPLRLSMLTHAFPRGSHRHLQLPVQVEVHRRVLPRRPRQVRVRAPVSHRQPTWILRIHPRRPLRVLLRFLPKHHMIIILITRQILLRLPQQVLRGVLPRSIICDPDPLP